MTECVVSAPGKVILHGEHSVVYGKVAVASSLNLRCFLRATFKDDDMVTLDLPDVHIHRQWSLASLQAELLPHLELGNEAAGSPIPPSEKSLRTLREFAGIQEDSAETRDLAVISFLYLLCSICGQGEHCRTLPHMHIRLISQLPVGAGLGSSAAFSVCLAAVLLQCAGQIHAPVGSTVEGRGDSTHKKTKRDSHEVSKADQLLINKWAFLGEKIIHGQPSGIDNSVSTFGGAIRFQNKHITPVDKMPRIQILLTNTKVPRSTKTLVANVRKRHDKFPEVMGPVLGALEGLAERSIKAYNALYDEPNSHHHYAQLEELIDMNQQLLNAIGVGHASLNTVVQLTAQHGLHTKLTGAGGGGCAYTLLTPDVADETIKAVHQDLQQQGFDCWDTSVGATGVSFHPEPHEDASIPPALFQ